LPCVKERQQIGVSERDQGFLRTYTKNELLKSSKPIFFGPNKHLEAGNRLEKFVPDLETNFHYHIETSNKDKQAAKKLGYYICVYTSKLRGPWHRWSVGEWLELIHLLRKDLGQIKIVIIGAKWDIHMPKLIENSAENIVNLTGTCSLARSIEVIRHAKYFIAYPSGLGVLATVVKTPVYMFYPPHLQGLIYSWAPPAMIDSGTYEGSLWKEPSKILKAIRRGMKRNPSIY